MYPCHMPTLNLFLVVACVRGCECRPNCFHHDSDGLTKKNQRIRAFCWGLKNSMIVLVSRYKCDKI